MNENKVKTVYLAGKITGDPKYRSKFRAAAQMLELSGFAVVNPATLPPSGFEYAAYIRMSAAMLVECEAVCFLNDWEDSAGARDEYELARVTGKEIFFFDEWRLKLKAGCNEAGQEAGQNALEYAT